MNLKDVSSRIFSLFRFFFTWLLLPAAIVTLLSFSCDACVPLMAVSMAVLVSQVMAAAVPVLSVTAGMGLPET